MKYCMTDTCFLLSNFSLKIVKHKANLQVIMTVGFALYHNTCYLEYENQGSVKTVSL